jgi:hypothetical protein
MKRLLIIFFLLPVCFAFRDHNQSICEAGGYNWIKGNITYPGTYSFTDDAAGAVPSDWVNGSTSSSSTCRVINGLDGHSKVLELKDADGSSLAACYNDFTAKQYGSVEAWMRVNDTDDMSSIWLLTTGGTTIALCRIDDNNFKYDDGTVQDVGVTAEDNTWYHVRIDFERTINGYMGLGQNNYQLVINESIYGPYSLKANYDVERVQVQTNTGELGYYFYVDAVGYSWDSEYNISDNLVPPCCGMTGLMIVSLIQLLLAT